MSHVTLHLTVMGQSFCPQADSLSRHRDRYSAPERNVGFARKAVRTEAFCARLSGCAG